MSYPHRKNLFRCGVLRNNVLQEGFDMAIQFLEDGGWVDTDGDGIREKDGVKAEFTLVYASSDSIRQILSMAVAEQARDLGISIDTAGYSFDELSQYNHSTASIYAGGENSPTSLNGLFHSSLVGTKFNNVGHYSNPKVDEYLEAAEAATDADTMNEMLKKAQWDGETGVSMIADAPACWLIKRNNNFFIREGLDVGDQTMHSHSVYGFQLLHNVAEWEWK